MNSVTPSDRGDGSRTGAIMRNRKAAVMTDEQARGRRTEILAEYAEAAEAEIAQNAATLEVPLNLRITKHLDTQLRQSSIHPSWCTGTRLRRVGSRPGGCCGGGSISGSRDFTATVVGSRVLILRGSPAWRMVSTPCGPSRSV